MQNLNEIALILLAVACVLMIVHGSWSIYLYFRYSALAKSYESLSNCDYVQEISKIAGIATRADRRTDALNESLETLNAKMAQRWRREDLKEKRDARETAAAVDAGDPEQTAYWPQMNQAQARQQQQQKPRLVRKVG